MCGIIAMLVDSVIRDSQVPGLWSFAAQAAVLAALLHLWQSEPQGGLAGPAAVLAAGLLQPSLLLPAGCS